MSADPIAEIEQAVEELLANLAALVDPPDVLAYVERLAARMRAEIDEGATEGRW